MVVSGRIFRYIIGIILYIISVFEAWTASICIMDGNFTEHDFITEMIEEVVSPNYWLSPSRWTFRGFWPVQSLVFRVWRKRVKIWNKPTERTKSLRKTVWTKSLLALNRLNKRIRKLPCFRWIFLFWASRISFAARVQKKWDICCFAPFKGMLDAAKTKQRIFFKLQLSHSIMYRNTHREINPTLHFAVPTVGIHQLICHTMPPNAQPRAKTNTKNESVWNFGITKHNRTTSPDNNRIFASLCSGCVWSESNQSTRNQICPSCLDVLCVNAPANEINPLQKQRPEISRSEFSSSSWRTDKICSEYLVPKPIRQSNQNGASFKRHGALKAWSLTWWSVVSSVFKRGLSPALENSCGSSGRKKTASHVHTTLWWTNIAMENGHL